MPSVTQIDINLAVIVAARKVQIARNWLDINHNRPGSVGLHQNAPYFLSVCLGRGAVLPSSVLSWPGQTCLFISWILFFFRFSTFDLAQELDISLSGGRTSVFRTLRTIWIFGDCDRIEIFDSTDFYDLFFSFFVLSSNKPSVDAGLFYSLLYLPMLMLFIMVWRRFKSGGTPPRVGFSVLGTPRRHPSRG